MVEHHGIVNKFLGDGFMAVFGAPDRRAATRALTAVDGRPRGARSASTRSSPSGRIPPTRVGLGLARGPAVVGNIGSARRKEYTVIGDVVNVASRVEALNKELGSQMLVTEEVWRAAGRSEATPRSHEPLQVRGRETPVRIYQLA